MLLDSHAPDARSRATIYVSQKARTSLCHRAPKDPWGTRTHGERGKQQVNGFADCPHFGVGAEVSRTRTSCVSGNGDPRKLLTHGHRKIRIGLVILVHDVKARVELLDPLVFQGQCFNLICHHGPLHRPCLIHHLRGPRVQDIRVLEVVGKASTEVLGFTDVNDTALVIAETVNTWRTRNFTGRGPPGRFLRLAHIPHFQSSGSHWSADCSQVNLTLWPRDRHHLPGSLPVIYPHPSANSSSGTRCDKLYRGDQ